MWMRVEATWRRPWGPVEAEYHHHVNPILNTDPNKTNVSPDKWHPVLAKRPKQTGLSSEVHEV